MLFAFLLGLCITIRNVFEPMSAESYTYSVGKYSRKNDGYYIQKFSDVEASKYKRRMYRNSFSEAEAPWQVASLLWDIFGRAPPMTSTPNGILIDHDMKERQSIHCDDKSMYSKIASKFLII